MTLNREEISFALRSALKLHESGNLDQAEQIYRQVLTVEPLNYDALHLCGCICIQKARHEEAINMLMAAINVFPETVDARYNLASLYQSLREWDKAVRLYEEVVSLQPAHPQALNNLGVSLKEANHLDYSERVLENLLANYPDSAEAYLNLGNTLRQKGLVEKSISAYRKSTELKPSASAYLNLGHVLSEGGRYEQAISSYKLAIELAPDYADAYLNMGNVLSKSGLHEDAILAYKKAIHVKADFHQAYLNLGNTYNELGDSEQAISAYEQALAVNPKFADAYLNLANILCARGASKQATSAFTSYYTLKPISTTIRSSSIKPQANKPVFKSDIEACFPTNADFIPSYIGESPPKGMHLLYLHIPKAGGIRFSNPIFNCIRGLFLQDLQNQSNVDKILNLWSCSELSVMASHRLDSIPMINGLAESLLHLGSRRLDYSFLTTHAASHLKLYDVLKEELGIEPIRLATWRTPEDRLRSALHYLWRTSNKNTAEIEKRILNRDPFLDNSIYRSCTGLFDVDLSRVNVKTLELDYLIDIGDFSVLNQIMSAYLSFAALPNIIVNKQVNVTSGSRKMSDDLLDRYLNQCLDKGYLQYDTSTLVSGSVCSSLPAEFDLGPDADRRRLHPLTFMVQSTTNVKTQARTWLLPTEFFLTEEGRQHLRDTFLNP